MRISLSNQAQLESVKYLTLAIGNQSATPFILKQFCLKRLFTCNGMLKRGGEVSNILRRNMDM